MKFGFRTPSVKKRISARTTGRLKRSAKSVIPGYGAKGMGLVKNPKKSLYNKVYHKTTVGTSDFKTPKDISYGYEEYQKTIERPKFGEGGCLLLFVEICIFLMNALYYIFCAALIGIVLYFLHFFL